MITIRYGINRRLPAVGKKRRQIEHQNGSLQVLRFNEQEIMAAIIKLHPGWAVTGFCVVIPKVRIIR